MLRALLAFTALSGPVLAAGVLLPGSASAQPIQGLYVGAGGGANFLSDERIRTNTLGAVTSTVPRGTRDSFDTGFGVVGSLGWGLGNGFRVELEGSYRSNDRDGGRPGPGVQSQTGREHKYGVMGNVLFDFDIGSPYVFPYFGAGGGYQWADQRIVETLAGGGVRRLSGEPGSFAYQAIAGAAFPIPGVVGLSATAEYRYLGMAGDRTYHGTLTSAGGTVAASRKMTEDNNHSLMLGVRYAFNVVPPAPPPAPVAVAAPAPAPARTYLVFFDWDKADLTARARQIVAEAAQASTRVAVTRIEVSGHADRSGTPQYNQVLSQRRADTVAAELVRDGVPRGNISVAAYGESRPLVPTADGVREPQNRRVEIVLK